MLVCNVVAPPALAMLVDLYFLQTCVVAGGVREYVVGGMRCHKVKALLVIGACGGEILFGADLGAGVAANLGVDFAVGISCASQGAGITSSAGTTDVMDTASSTNAVDVVLFHAINSLDA